MSAAVLATVGHGSTTMWYLTRASGLISFVTLSATVVLGIVSSLGVVTDRWPRFASQLLHRNLSLFSLAVIGLHILTTVSDGFVPIGFIDAFVPFHSPYRPMWVGFGALAFDLLLAVAVTSGLRRRIGAQSWRMVHWLAYLSWPVALLHGLGSGSDTRITVAFGIEVVCALAVVAAVALRLIYGEGRYLHLRIAAGITTAAVALGTTVFAIAGPLQPGWAQRSGTSKALLTQLAAAFAPSGAAAAGAGSSSSSSSAGTGSAGSTGSGTAGSSGGGSSSGSLPAAPFTAGVQGTISTSSPNSSGMVTVTLDLTLSDTSTPLVVQLTGVPVGEGVSMTSSNVTFGADQGSVTGLDGSTINVQVSGAGGGLDITLGLRIHQESGRVTGSASGSATA